ncbi:MAG TPA: PQQ-dependent sugar dehydrogenase [Pseudonocardiaceae bacterium]
MFRRVFALVAGAVALAGMITVSNRAADLPAVAAMAQPAARDGFVFRDLPTGVPQGEYLTDFAYLPDGSLISITKGGRAYWAPASGEPRLIAALDVSSVGDLGLIGVAVSPGFRSDRTLYTVRGVPATGEGAGANGKFLASAWIVTVDGDGNPTGLTGERVLLEAPTDDIAHGMTTVLAAEDGTLWISIGDSASYAVVDPQALRALDLDDPHGKILHVDQDGSGVETNPYYQTGAPNSWRSRVWASGFRSPFRLSLHPTSGLPIVGDVGWSEIEEVDLVQRGGNYGWPCWEGPQRTVGYRELPACASVGTVAPLYSYPRPAGNSVTGGVVYTGSSYPAAYQGAYFFGDFGSGAMWTMAFDDAGQLVRVPEVPPFATGLGGPVKFATAPNGDIVYGSLYSGVVRQLVYEPGNNPPAADIQATNDPSTRTVAFDGSGSTDPNGDALSYQWDFGDGTTGAGSAPAHTYRAGQERFTVRLTVTDPLGASGTAQLTVFPANHSPVLTVDAPDPDRRFAVGDLVTASASATDVEDGAGPVTQALRWNATLVHCRQLSCHDHPGIEQTGPNFAMTFNGHPGDSRLVITVTATDSRGAMARRSFDASPLQRRLTVQSSVPAGFVLGDVSAASSLFTVGQVVTVVAPALALDGLSTFDGWADGAPRIRQVTIGDEDTTLVATYLSPIDRRYRDDAALRATLGEPIGLEQIGESLRWRRYANGRLYWTPELGITEVHGGIAAAFEAHNAEVGFGVPITEESGSPDGRGRFNDFAGGKSIYWTPQTGAHTILGGIRTKWRTVGAEQGYVGYPSTDETVTPDGVGAYNDFDRLASIYWSPATDAKIVRQDIRRKWYTLGAQAGFLGYPTTDETATADGIGAFNRFRGGSIYYSNLTGSWSVRAGIEQKWRSFGAEASFLGYPTTDETLTPDGIGAYNFFQRGAVYYSPSTGVHEVHGGIRLRWTLLGAERSYLGYPISDEYGVPGGARSDFQYGYIIWVAKTGQMIDRRY